MSSAPPATTPIEWPLTVGTPTAEEAPPLPDRDHAASQTQTTMRRNPTAMKWAGNAPGAVGVTFSDWDRWVHQEMLMKQREELGW